MNIAPITNYFQTTKTTTKKYATNNINFGMAKLDQVQLSKSKEDYYQKTREDYIRYFWTFHPENEQYIPRLESVEADKKHFIDNCTPEETKALLNACKYGKNKNQTFYQAINLNGYYNLAPQNRYYILEEIYRLPALEDEEQRRTVLSELAEADISEFENFIFHNMHNYQPAVREKILNADTFLWDTLDTEHKRHILRLTTKETELKLVAQEMEKLSEVKPEENQESILAFYAKEDSIGNNEFARLIAQVDKETLINWMKKDNVFIKNLRVRDVIKLANIIGVEEFDKLYGEKYGKLFGSFFNPSYKESAIRWFGIDNYKKQYEEKYGDWEKIKYDSFLHDTKNSSYGIKPLDTLKSARFKELTPEYQADFIIKILNEEIKTSYFDLYTTFDNSELQNIVVDYAINNEDTSIEDSIKILEGLLKIYFNIAEYYKNCGGKSKVNIYQNKIISTQIAIQALKTQIQ